MSEPLTLEEALAARAPGCSVRAICPVLIWPHIGSDQMFVRVYVHGAPVEAELSVSERFQFAEQLMRNLGTVCRR